jgi:teichoic acid transport system permease protein
MTDSASGPGRKKDLAARARAAHLTPVNARAPLWTYLRDAWAWRQFIWTMARYRVASRLSEYRLGLAWVVIRPMLLATVFGLIFGLIMPRSSRPENFIPFLVVGVFVFEFFARSLSAGAKAIVGNDGLVKSLSFPRIVLPTSTTAEQVIEIVPVVGVMFVILLVFGEPLSWTWLLVVPVIALMALFNLGAAFVMARLTTHIRDVAQVIPFLVRLIFYATGIFYSLETVLADRPTLLALAQLNPVHAYVSLVRGLTLEGAEPTAMMWTVAVVAAVVSCVVGVVYFWLAEDRYGES